jgi:hypothetical protein
LRALYDAAASAITGRYQDRETVYLLGGLNGDIAYRGVGICRLGKEKEAGIATLLAAEGNRGQESGVRSQEPGVRVLQETLAAVRHSLHSCMRPP